MSAGLGSVTPESATVRILGGYCPDCGKPKGVHYGDDHLSLGTIVRAEEARQATCSKCKKPMLIQTEPVDA